MVRLAGDDAAGSNFCLQPRKRASVCWKPPGVCEGRVCGTLTLCSPPRSPCVVLYVMTAGSPVPCLLSQPWLNEQLIEKKAGAGGEGDLLLC